MASDSFFLPAADMPPVFLGVATLAVDLEADVALLLCAHRRFIASESFRRPDERRRFRTLRPPAVAMRDRKPWRRLRTSLLG